jgi:hypothetical protein
MIVVVAIVKWVQALVELTRIQGYDHVLVLSMIADLT